MRIINDISLHPSDNTAASLCNSLVEADQTSRARVVAGDFSATPTPFTAHALGNLLSPISNIRAISCKLCMRFSVAIVQGHRS